MGIPVGEGDACGVGLAFASGPQSSPAHRPKQNDHPERQRDQHGSLDGQIDQVSRLFHFILPGLQSVTALYGRSTSTKRYTTWILSRQRGKGESRGNFNPPVMAHLSRFDLPDLLPVDQHSIFTAGEAPDRDVRFERFHNLDADLVWIDNRIDFDVDALLFIRL